MKLFDPTRGSKFLAALFISALLINQFAPPQKTYAAIALNNTSDSGDKNSADPWAWDHTVGASDTLLVVKVIAYISTSDITGVTFNEESMTQAVSQVSGGSGRERAAIYYIVNPDVGTYEVSVDFSGNSSGRAYAESFSGTDATQPDDTASTSGEAKAASTSVTASQGAYLTDVLAMETTWASARTPDGSQTEEPECVTTSVHGSASYKGTVSSGSQAMEWTWDGIFDSNYAHAVMAIAPIAYSLEQEGFAFGDDNGNEAAHTLDTQDTNITEELGTKTVRAILDATGDPSDNAYKLKFQKDGSGGYEDVPVGSATTAEITFVDSTSNSAVNGGDVVVDLTDIADLAEDDIVILSYAIGDNDDGDFTMAISSGAGWTKIADLYSNDSDETNLGVFWKIMGATPDTTVTVDGLGGSDASTTAVAMAFRGVDQTTPLDVTTTTATGINSVLANPPSIDHNGSTGTIVVAVGAGAHGGGVQTYTGGAGYTTNFATIGANDTTDSTIGMGHSLSPSDPEDPPVFAFSGSDGTTLSWCAATVALRAAAAVDNEVYISPSANVAAGGEATTARLTAPSGKSGDFTTGRRWDDENGDDSIDIASAFYTELEWVLTTQSPAATDDYFEFRVYNGDVAIDTYTLTPKWTIGVVAAARRIFLIQ